MGSEWKNSQSAASADRESAVSRGVKMFSAVLVQDVDTGIILDIQDDAADFLGVTKDQLVGQHPGDFGTGVPPYDRPTALVWLKKAREIGPQRFAWKTMVPGGGPPIDLVIDITTLIIDGTRRAVSHLRQITEDDRIEESLIRQSQMGDLISELAGDITGASTGALDAVIEVSLRKLAEFAGAHRGYVWQLSEDKSEFEMTHQWCDSSVFSKEAVPPKLRVQDLPWWINQLNGGKAVVVADVSRLTAQALAEKELLTMGAVGSFINVPMMVQGRPVGMLGFSSTVRGREWTPAEIALLRFASQIVVSSLIRSKSERELRRSEEHLIQAQKMEAVGRLAGGIAHDFNNLLTGISGYAEIGVRRSADEEQCKEIFSEIVGASERAARLTNQLLVFSRKKGTEQQILDLNSAILQSQNMLSRIIGEGVQLEFQPSSTPCTVYIDPSHLDQLLVNFVANSRDAILSSGTILIKTARVHINTSGVSPQIPGARERRAWPTGDYVYLSVQDDGEGMSPEVYGRVFEPFFTTKAPGRGTGIGLSTAYGVVQQGGGDIWLTSLEGEGTTVHVLLPHHHGIPQGKVEHVGDLPRGSEKILLVEDDNLVRHMARQTLEEHGYEVVAVEGGLQALALSEQADFSFDLLLSDVVMPHMNGPALLERLRKLYPELPCCFMSGYAEEVLLAHGEQLSGRAVIAKPFSIRTLCETVRSALDAKRES